MTGDSGSEGPPRPSASPRPPRPIPGPVRLILRILVPERDREFYLGDLDEGGTRSWPREIMSALALRMTPHRGGPRKRAGGGPLRSAVQHFGRDVRLGLRHLARSPVATATVFTALSLGIGMSALLFSLIRGGLLPVLPLEAGERIVRITQPGAESFTAATFEHWQARQRSFVGVGAWTEEPVALAIEGRGSQVVQGAALDPGALPLLGVRPVLGRLHVAADAEPGAPAVVLLSEAMWRTYLDADPSALGRTVRVGGQPAQIVGILPDGFGFPWNQDVWTPLPLDPLRAGDDAPLLSVFGILREGVSRETARAELAGLETQRPREPLEPEPGPIEVRAFTDIINPAGQSYVVGGILLAVAFLVLLVACANATNVLLARSAVRAREVAVRMALGASRGHIARQFWTEVSLLAGAGAGGGIALAAAGVAVVRNSVPPDSGMPFWFDLRIDPGVVAFVAVTAVVTAMLAGVLPVWAASRGTGNALLQDASRGSTSGRSGSLMRRLISLEMGVSFVLLVAAGLFIRSAVNLQSYRFPFEPEEIHTSLLQLPRERYLTDEERIALFERLEETLEAIPGARSAAVTNAYPGIGAPRGRIAVEGMHDPAGATLPEVRSVVVSPGFFEVFDAAPRTGRILEDGDRAGELPVAVVNRAFELRFLPDGAVGQRVRLPAPGAPGELWTIVGVVPDLLHGGLEGNLEEAVYRAVAQAPTGNVRFVLRSTGPATALAFPFRDAVAAVDPDLAPYFSRSLQEAIDGANAQYAWVSALFLVAGLMALFLAAIGLYGVMAFWVAQRVREIGIRMALGGARGSVVRLVVGQAMTQVAVGMLGGLVVAVPVAWYLHGVLLDVVPFDPLVFGAVPAVLVLAGCLGCLVPALRATRVEPRTALAAE